MKEATYFCFCKWLIFCGSGWDQKRTLKNAMWAFLASPSASLRRSEEGALLLRPAQF